MKVVLIIPSKWIRLFFIDWVYFIIISADDRVPSHKLAGLEIAKEENGV